MPAVPSVRGVLWFWGKVVACLVCLDLALFQTGWLLRQGGRRSGWERVAQGIAQAPPEGPLAYVIGSSVVRSGVRAAGVESKLRAAGFDGAVRLLSIEGIRASGAALVARATFDGPTPWLVVYGTATRDYVVPDPLPAGEIAQLRSSPFFDSAIELAALPRSPEEQVEAVVKRYWGLYRYRQLARRVVGGKLAALGSWVTPSSAGAAPQRSPEDVAADVHLGRGRFAGPRREAWKRWWKTRSPHDYLRFLELNPELMQLYEAQPALEEIDLAESPEWDSLRWMLETFAERGVRVVVVDFPENPFFRRRNARRYFDPGISDAAADTLAEETARFGAHFVDLRGFLGEADFDDLLHANFAGAARLTERIGEIVVEQARASPREAQASP
jgi:hypothetical protein